MRNSYGSLVEQWKVDLILRRARRKRFRPDELEDVQQDVIQAVVAFQFDPQRSNGATEATALTALIDRQLTFIQRGQARRHQREERYRRLHGVVDGRPAPDAVEPSHADAVALALDVRDSIARLTPVEQSVCASLARGDARAAIARHLGVTRYEVERLSGRIREQFTTWGLDGWVNGR